MENYISEYRNNLRRNLLDTYSNAPQLVKSISIQEEVIEKAEIQQVEQEDIIEKGRGKNAEIGERREHSGNVYIKTATGWVYQSKSGKHMHYENATKKSFPASQEHIDLHSKHIGGAAKNAPEAVKPTSTAAVESVKAEDKQDSYNDLKNSLIDFSKHAVKLSSIESDSAKRTQVNSLKEKVVDYIRKQTQGKKDSETIDKLKKLSAEKLNPIVQHALSLYIGDAVKNQAVANINMKSDEGQVYIKNTQKVGESKDDKTENKQNIKTDLKTAFEDAKAETEKVKKKVNELYTKNHRNQGKVELLYKDLEEKGKILAKKFPDIKFDFQITSDWYDGRTKASLSSHIGAHSSYDFIEKFSKEWEQEKKQYPNSYNRNRFISQKIDELCKEAGIKKYDRGYVTTNSRSYLTINTEEIN